MRQEPPPSDRRGVFLFFSQAPAVAVEESVLERAENVQADQIDEDRPAKRVHAVYPTGEFAILSHRNRGNGEQPEEIDTAPGQRIGEPATQWQADEKHVEQHMHRPREHGLPAREICGERRHAMRNPPKQAT